MSWNKGSITFSTAGWEKMSCWLIASGKTLSERIDTILKQANVQIAAVVVIADRMVQQNTEDMIGSRLIEEKYHTKLYSVITEEDTDHAIQNQII